MFQLSVLIFKCSTLIKMRKKYVFFNYYNTFQLIIPPVQKIKINIVELYFDRESLTPYRH